MCARDEGGGIWDAGCGMRDAKITIRITGLWEKLGWDNGIEELYWALS